MKKLPLLLICTMMLTPVSAHAKTIDTDTLLNVLNIVQQQQKTNGDKKAAAINILKALGVDVDNDELINSLLPGSKCQPTAEPADEPAVEPTEEPAAEPTEEPAAEPTEAPTAEPTAVPTAKPTAVPTAKPTAKPTAAPTAKPTARPTAAPTAKPTAKPTAAPTARPTAVPSVSSETAMEQEVLRLVNAERAKYGLNALTWAEDLAKVARAHSADMINRHFFDHTNPDGKSPFDRMRAAGISYRSAGENIAYGQRTPEAVMNAWMNSSGHRANILNSSYKELGVGAVKNSGGTIYWTQEFVSR